MYHTNIYEFRQEISNIFQQMVISEVSNDEPISNTIDQNISYGYIFTYHVNSALNNGIQEMEKSKKLSTDKLDLDYTLNKDALMTEQEKLSKIIDMLDEIEMKAVAFTNKTCKRTRSLL